MIEYLTANKVVQRLKELSVPYANINNFRIWVMQRKITSHVFPGGRRRLFIFDEVMKDWEKNIKPRNFQAVRIRR